VIAAMFSSEVKNGQAAWLVPDGLLW